MLRRNQMLMARAVDWKISERRRRPKPPPGDDERAGAVFRYVLLRLLVSVLVLPLVLGIEHSMAWVARAPG